MMARMISVLHCKHPSTIDFHHRWPPEPLSHRCLRRTDLHPVGIDDRIDRLRREAAKLHVRTSPESQFSLLQSCLLKFPKFFFAVLSGATGLIFVPLEIGDWRLNGAPRICTITAVAANESGKVPYVATLPHREGEATRFCACQG